MKLQMYGLKKLAETRDNAGSIRDFLSHFLQRAQVTFLESNATSRTARLPQAV